MFLAILLALSCGQAHRPTAQAVPPACQQYPAVTNYVIGSQDMFSGSWAATDGAGSYGCSLTGSYAESPPCVYASNIHGCGRVAATRIQCPSVLSGALNIFYQENACPSGTKAGGVFYTGTRFDLQVGGSCRNCEASSTHARCNIDNAAAGNRLAIGNQSGTNGCASGARAAVDITVWQYDCQNSAYLTPPIETGGTAVTRPAGCVVPPTKHVCGLGDSIFNASGSGGPQVATYVAYELGGSANTYGWIAEGVAGNTCTQMLARWPGIKAANPQMSHLVIMCGVNGARTGLTAAQEWAAQESIINDAVALGIKVRLVKTLNYKGSSGWSVTGVTMINDMNVLQQAWCDAHGLACADCEATIENGSDEIRDDMDQDDKIHLNALGHATLKTCITVYPQRAAEGWN